MRIESFLQKYANTPLSERHTLIKMSESDPLTLDEIYVRVKKLDDEMRPQRIEMQRLIDRAQWYWINKEND